MFAGSNFRKIVQNKRNSQKFTSLGNYLGTSIYRTPGYNGHPLEESQVFPTDKFHCIRFRIFPQGKLISASFLQVIAVISYRIILLPF